MPNYECRIVLYERRPDVDPILLSDRELLSLLIGEKTAARMYQGSLLSLCTAGAVDQELHPRIGAALELVRRVLREDLKHTPVLSSPTAVRDYIRLLLIGKEHEMFVVLLLDAQNRVIDAEELFRGTLTQTSVYPREVVKCALRHNAAAVIFAHNHPSGVAEPSHADEVLTQALKQALALVDVKVLDHFVVAGTAALSFAERGLI
jgi:DNA repair protein RadC